MGEVSRKHIRGVDVPELEEAEMEVGMPCRNSFRQRAHCNPLSDGFISYPISPSHVDWSLHYPKYFKTKTDPQDIGESKTQMYLNTFDHPIIYGDEVVAYTSPKNTSVTILDIGCGYGGLSFQLAQDYPDKLILGLEIREKVVTYFGEKVRALRLKHEASATGGATGGCDYQNVSVIRTNAMKFLPNYFVKGSIEKMFFCFPDPQFKASKWRRRIISESLLTLYGFLLQDKGWIYVVSDVEDFFQWAAVACNNHPLFEQVPQDEAEKDKLYQDMQIVTEESQKARRQGRAIFAGAWRRKDMC